jgi:hypothetical protein
MQKRAGGVAQVVQHLPSKFEAPSLKSHTTSPSKKKKERKGKGDIKDF